MSRELEELEQLKRAREKWVKVLRSHADTVTEARIAYTSALDQVEKLDKQIAELVMLMKRGSVDE